MTGCEDECREVLRGEMAKLGVEVAVSNRPPIVGNPYVTDATCPHGVTWYFEPTSDQIADWAARGIR